MKSNTLLAADGIENPSRRLFTCAAALAGLGLPAYSVAQEASFPTRPVRIIVNYPPGGPADLVARVLGVKLSQAWKQPVTVENISGAAGGIGAAKVAQAQPDGHTILLSIDAPFTSSAALNPATAPALSSFAPVALLGVTGLAIAAHPSLGVNSLAELVQKGRQDDINFSTAGIGSPGHFSALMLSEATGIKVNSIHYRGNAPAVMALLSGEVQAGILASTGLLPHLKADKINGLALMGSQRSAVLPDLKTATELGNPAVRLESMFIVMAPAKTPAAAVSVLHKALTDAMKAPDAQERWKTLDIAPTTATGAELSKTMQEARSRFESIVKATGMKPNQ